MTTRAAATLDKYLAYLWDNSGSDLLLTAGAPPLARVDGALAPIPGTEPLDGATIEKLTAGVMPQEHHERFRTGREVDFSFSWEGKARFRANAFHQRRTVALAVRLIPFAIPSFEELGLPAVAERLVNLQQGLVLVTGPTGAGKSTTLAAMLDWINEHRQCHILTIEDPIEYVHSHKRSAVNQREVGDDTDSFERALRSALREDPDVLLVGEMRDLESIQIALTIAETGHLVFATLHTNDTAQALDRIVDVFPGDRQDQIRVQLANTLAAVVHQRLVPKKDGGRVAAFEVLVANHAIRNLVREGKSRQIRNMLVAGQNDGMQTLEMSLNDLVARGLVDYEEALGHALVANEVRRPTPPAVVPNGSRRR
ncbi:MAG TPA: type IV pilus twitching motility protein PilT [Acidimicrobiales bacterium]|nr:type IV pilus twitching motility protein PilT [Acidimicrobiales bacterium]